jgi:GlpG protein
VLGSWIEAELSRAVWAAFFVLAAVVSAASELAVSGQAAHGVSGVVYAMFGLMWAGRRAIPSWAEIATYKNLQVFVWWGVFCIVATLFGWLQVANAAHFGGLYFGFAFGYLFIARRRKALSAAALAALAAVSVCAVVWMPWSIRWSNWKASSLALRGDYAGAIEWHRHAIWLGDDPSAGLNRILLLELARGNPDGVRRAREELSRLPGAAGVGM